MGYILVFQSQSRNQGRKEMQSLAISNFSIPGDGNFPMNAMYAKPSSRQEEGDILFYLNIIYILGQSKMSTFSRVYTFVRNVKEKVIECPAHSSLVVTQLNATYNNIHM